MHDKHSLTVKSFPEPFALSEITDEPPVFIPEAQSVFLGGLFCMAILTVCYFAAEIILPIVLAFILKLVLQPIMRTLTKLHVPRGLAALLIIVLLFGGLGALGVVLSAPASHLAKQISGDASKLQERLSFLTDPIMAIQGVLHHADGLTDGTGTKTVTVAVEGSRFSDRLLTNTRSFAAGAFQTVLVVFFLLIGGDTFLRRLVEILPSFQNKRQAVEISQHIESDISAYLATITIMNMVVGLATGLTMAVCKIGDPVLWGTLAFLLNYIPVIGPFVGITTFSMLGLLLINDPFAALLPAGIYFLIHLTESMFLTPHFLAKRFTLNPVLVILALIFWYWMWGTPGAILSTPMLAITKIVCDHIAALKPLGHFIEGEPKGEPAIGT